MKKEQPLMFPINGIINAHYLEEVYDDGYMSTKSTFKKERL